MTLTGQVPLGDATTPAPKKIVIARVDMQARDSGLVLLTGSHGYPASPQASLKRTAETGWAIDDSYGDPDRNGKSVRPDFYIETGSRYSALRMWLRHLGVDPAAVAFEVHREYR